MQTYVAFLRGINVGGKNVMSMASLRDCLTAAGLKDVRTYIQSGNVLFTISQTDHALGLLIAKAINQSFAFQCDVAVFSAKEWQAVLRAAPTWWGQQDEWKHNILILTKDDTPDTVVELIGALTEDLEALSAGNRVVYQSVSFDKFSRTAGGKLASKPIYKSMTIRNYNTAQKIGILLND